LLRIIVSSGVILSCGLGDGVVVFAGTDLLLFCAIVDWVDDPSIVVIMANTDAKIANLVAEIAGKDICGSLILGSVRSLSFFRRSRIFSTKVCV